MNDNFIFNFFRNLFTVLHSGCTNLYFHNSVGEVPFLYILSSIYLCLFDDSYSDRFEAISYYDFDLHFSNG